MSRTLNRPAFNIAAPTAPHPAARHLGVKVARAVARNVDRLQRMLAGPIEARRIGKTDRWTFALAGLTAQDGPLLQLTESGRDLAAQL